MVPYAPATPSAKDLPDTLARVRRDGFALSRGEFKVGAIAVAVPVYASGEVACSLTIAGPVDRCDNETFLRRALRLLRQTAAELGEELGT
jgi:DNA-binding IclR family transcriptional regulator